MSSFKFQSDSINTERHTNTQRKEKGFKFQSDSINTGYE